MSKEPIPLTPDMALSHPAILNRVPSGLAWHLSRKRDKCRVNTLRELAAWGRPQAGQWRGYGEVKLGILDSLIREAGLEWQGAAPTYPRGNPMYEPMPPDEQLLPENDIVSRMRLAVEKDWIARFPINHREIVSLAIKEIIDLRAALNEARREVCAWEGDCADGEREYARQRGWDCFGRGE